MDVVLCTASYDILGSAIRDLHPHLATLGIAVAGNPSLKLYDVHSKSNTPLSQFDGHTSNITAVHFQSNNRWIMTASEDCTVKIWDVRAPNVQREFKVDTSINDALIHPNQGEIVTGEQGGTVSVWDLAENRCSLRMIPEPSVAIRTVGISPDATYICAGNNKGNVYAWKTEGGCEVSSLRPWMKIAAHGKYITRCVVSPDAKLLATCSADSTVKIWNTEVFPFALERTLTGHTRWIWDAAFSADSAYLVTASSDSTARLWDVTSGETIRLYSGHSKAVVCCALHDVCL